MTYDFLRKAPDVGDGAGMDADIAACEHESKKAVGNFIALKDPLLDFFTKLKHLLRSPVLRMTQQGESGKGEQEGQSAALRGLMAPRLPARARSNFMSFETVRCCYACLLAC